MKPHSNKYLCTVVVIFIYSTNVTEKCFSTPLLDYNTEAYYLKTAVTFTSYSVVLVQYLNV